VFVQQCRKVVLRYCEHGGSSAGMTSFLRTRLLRFAKQNPSVEVVVAPRPGHHPYIRSHYLTGNPKTINTKNMSVNEILASLSYVVNSSGHKVRDLRKKTVLSTNESVRGMWDPFHGPQLKL